MGISALNGRISNPTTVNVSNIRLFLCGASSWASASPNRLRPRYVSVFNNSATQSLNIFLQTPGVPPGSAPRVAVVPALGDATFYVSGGDSLLAARDAATPEQVTAFEVGA